MVPTARQAMDELLRAASQGTPFDLAIIDFMMPEMDGEALGRTIRQHPDLCQIPMVLLTSSALRGDAARAREVGFDAYLAKPIKQSHLFDTIITVLTGRGAGSDKKKNAKSQSMTLAT